MSKSSLPGVVLVLLAMTCAFPASARQDCGAAMAAAERANPGLPANLLRAIGVIESGRRDPLTGQLDAWPWSVNAEGSGHVFNNRQEAIAYVRDAQARGIRSIDVGCMQINLMFHPNAFASLDEAFAPEVNIRYAAAFLLELYQHAGDWTTALGYYHSATLGLSEPYAERVKAAWQMMPREAVGAAVPGWIAATLGRSRAVLREIGTPRVRVVVPGGPAIHQFALRGAGTLPRVYNP